MTLNPPSKPTPSHSSNIYTFKVSPGMFYRLATFLFLPFSNWLTGWEGRSQVEKTKIVVYTLYFFTNAFTFLPMCYFAVNVVPLDNNIFLLDISRRCLMVVCGYLMVYSCFLVMSDLIVRTILRLYKAWQNHNSKIDEEFDN